METGTHDDLGGNSLNIQELQNFANIDLQKSEIVRGSGFEEC